ncbi:hypothetical protein BaRGS_00023681 [Batillaria attramentaria]|uniref:Secreted protein n=1 Tax=Batillaria attramentaria TaxID=370345 RepID=A0ABD0KDE8_9CAEN
MLCGGAGWSRHIWWTCWRHSNRGRCHGDSCPQFPLTSIRQRASPEFKKTPPHPALTPCCQLKYVSGSQLVTGNEQRTFDRRRVAASTDTSS